MSGSDTRLACPVTEWARIRVGGSQTPAQYARLWGGQYMMLPGSKVPPGSVAERLNQMYNEQFQDSRNDGHWAQDLKSSKTSLDICMVFWRQSSLWTHRPSVPQKLPYPERGIFCGRDSWWRHETQTLCTHGSYLIYSWNSMSDACLMTLHWTPGSQKDSYNPVTCIKFSSITVNDDQSGQ